MRAKTSVTAFLLITARDICNKLLVYEIVARMQGTIQHAVDCSYQHINLLLKLTTVPGRRKVSQWAELVRIAGWCGKAPDVRCTPF